MTAKRIVAGCLAALCIVGYLTIRAQSAGRLDLTIQQGATFSLQLTFADGNGDPIDLTGYAGAAEVRTSYDAATPVATLSVAVTDPTNGVMTLSLTAAQTAALTAPSGGVWDLLLTTPTGDKFRVLEGNVRITAAVTR